MKKLLLITALMSLQTIICKNEGSCCSSCPTPKVEVKKEEAKEATKVIVLPKEEKDVEVVEAEVLIEEAVPSEVNVNVQE